VLPPGVVDATQLTASRLINLENDAPFLAVLTVYFLPNLQAGGFVTNMNF
jgi:hypothetical protein